jgi:hypothetical protein
VRRGRVLLELRVLEGVLRRGFRLLDCDPALFVHGDLG